MVMSETNVECPDAQEIVEALAGRHGHHTMSAIVHTTLNPAPEPRRLGRRRTLPTGHTRSPWMRSNGAEDDPT